MGNRRPHGCGARGIGVRGWADGDRHRVDMRDSAHRASFVPALIVFLLLSPIFAGLVALPALAHAEDAGSSASKRVFRCDRRHATGRDFAYSNGTVDVYNGLTWLAGTAGIAYGTNPSRRWTKENAFDSAIQSALRIDPLDGRRDADTASDVFAALAIGALPAAAIGAHYFRMHDCIETWDMIGDTFEAVSLAFFASEVIKVVTGRERPFGDRCTDSPPRDANCRDDDRNLSFPSGHATLAAAGAGVSCRFSFESRAFGNGPAARAAPCLLGAAAALTSGGLRIASDRHWASDVLVGFGLGIVVGYVDTFGPFDWLRVEKQDAQGQLRFRGRVLPFAQQGQLGLQWTMVY